MAELESRRLLLALSAARVRDLRQWERGRDEADVSEFIEGLGGSQVAYLFECRQCGVPLVRWDQD